MRRHEVADQTTPEITCPDCDGKGIRPHYILAGCTMQCTTCYGGGVVTRPDEGEIVRVITTRNGLACKAPELRGAAYREATPAQKLLHYRAYYVWRMARFHGGKDVRMPVMASVHAEHDPYLPTLDAMADAVAVRFLGTKFAAAARWGSALGLIDRVPAGLPATAYPCGPVHDGVEEV